jgi:uncharacterized coiled-coil protein SlyX
VLTSADGLYPVRFAFQRIGITELNRAVYEEVSKILSQSPKLP